MAGALPSGLSPRYWRTWRPDGPIAAALQTGEAWIGSWDGLGLYEGNNKIPGYQSLIFHLTTHRLLLEPISDPSMSSSTKSTQGLSASLRDIRQTEFYTGFMRSSAKITLSLGLPFGVKGTNETRNSSSEEEDSWACGVCGYRNGGDEGKCGLCGVGKDRIPHSRAGTPGPASRTSLDRPGTPNGQTSVAVAIVPAASGGKLTCPACTFLNHGSMKTCEICATPLPKSTQSNGSPTPTITPRVAAGVADGKLDIVRLSFRKGGEKVAYAKLKSVLSQKEWERQEIVVSNGGSDGASATRPSGGIDGILQTMSIDAKNRSANVSSAFADLEVLMVRAGEMVKLAQTLNDKLISQQKLNPPTGGAEKAKQEQEATLIRTSLVQLGLPAPALTSDMVRSDKDYLEGLAKELGALLTGHTPGKGKTGVLEGLMVGKKGRGVIGLDEVWGLWMRARGIALLSPSTLVSILPFLADQTSPPIKLRDLPSGLKVLFSPTYSPSNILYRLIDVLLPDAPTEGDSDYDDIPAEKSLSLIEISAYEGLAIGLAKELMEEIERIDDPAGGKGGIYSLVRDDQAEQGAGGVRWYRDIIIGWTLEA